MFIEVLIKKKGGLEILEFGVEIKKEADAKRSKEVLRERERQRRDTRDDKEATGRKGL